MANAGTLYVSILAKTGGFKKGMKYVNKQVAQFRKNLSTATIAAGVGIAAMIKKEMDEIASTGKLAERLGAGTEQLAAFREVAQDAGVDFTRVSAGLERLSVSAGKAVIGDEKLTEAFKYLGVSLEDIKTLSPDMLMVRVSSGLDRIQNSSERAAYAQKIFGKSGVSLLGFMRGLKANTALAALENKKLGLSFSDIDAKKVNDAKIAMNNLLDITTGLFTQLTIQLAPKIQEVSEYLYGMGTAGDSMANKVGRGIDKVTAAYNVARNMILQTASAVMKVNDFVLATSPAAKFFDWLSGGKISGMSAALGADFSAAVKSPFDGMNPTLGLSDQTMSGTITGKKVDKTNELLGKILTKIGGNNAPVAG